MAFKMNEARFLRLAVSELHNNYEQKQLSTLNNNRSSIFRYPASYLHSPVAPVSILTRLQGCVLAGIQQTHICSND